MELRPDFSIVVLPFANLSNDPSQDYFADGITENLTTGLSRLSGAFVIAPPGFAARGKERDGSAEFGSNLSRRLQSDGGPLLGPEHRQVGQALDAETARKPTPSRHRQAKQQRRLDTNVSARPRSRRSSNCCSVAMARLSSETGSGFGLTEIGWFARFATPLGSFELGRYSVSHSARSPAFRARYRPPVSVRKIPFPGPPRWRGRSRGFAFAKLSAEEGFVASGYQQDGIGAFQPFVRTGLAEAEARNGETEAASAECFRLSPVRSGSTPVERKRSFPIGPHILKSFRVWTDETSSAALG